MRIIGGQHKGYRFQPPNNIPARPTTDLAREALFNILHHVFDFDHLTALDLFGGTGSISYELASRGCAAVTLVEQHRASTDFVRQTAQRLSMPIEVVRADVFRYIAQCHTQYHLIIADPPYSLPTLARLPQLIFAQQMLLPNAWLVLEHDVRHQFEQHPHFHSSRQYGTTLFSIFEQPADATN